MFKQVMRDEFLLTLSEERLCRIDTVTNYFVSIKGLNTTGTLDVLRIDGFNDMET